MPCLTREPTVADCQQEKPEPEKREGVCCLRCGSRFFEVLYTRHVGPWTVRMKRCRHCGAKLRTSEKIRGDGT